ncbi:hypothetical protein SAMN05216551_105306 [Chitinasiproducens palmae]|uniref:Phage protein n=2 Tax=Chitinasiproducens palmae TaxID=1770053 RepID=A0A1H2PQL5_9BURK|nr:hypothetical protein SAMN05216551_105306 [Chitinasiproducens palmae]
MAHFGISIDASGLNDRLREVVDRKLPYAQRAALNDLATEVRGELVRKMREVFDRPTPYTLNALYLRRATTQQLTAEVGIKDEAYKGTPAAKYLAPQIEGGRRNTKGVENALARRSARAGELLARLGLSGQFVPAAAASLDAYGNVQRGQYSKLLSQLGAQGDAYTNETPISRGRREGKAGAKGRRKRAGPRFFIAGLYRARHLAPGIWVRYPFAHGWAIRPVLLAARSTPQYSQRFPFYETADEVVDTFGDELLRQAIEREFGS